MKKILLGDIADVRAATIFREKAPVQDAYGNVRSLTIKDFVADWPINFSRLPKITVAPEMLKHCLVGEEVLMPTRGNRYPARFFPITSEAVFPYGQINIIYPHEQILGRYLAWYINQPKTQRDIQGSLTGTGIQALVKQRLLELTIELPSISIQQQIATLQNLKEESKATKEKLIDLEEQEVEWNCRLLFERD